VNILHRNGYKKKKKKWREKKKKREGTESSDPFIYFNVLPNILIPKEALSHTVGDVISIISVDLSMRENMDIMKRK
jgi:hypothetical protein